jgi:type IV secretory pathway VirJ component
MFSRALEPWVTPTRSGAVRWRRSAYRTLSLAACALCTLCGCRSEPRRERLQHGRFEAVELLVPERPHGVVLVLARPEDATIAERVSALASERGAVAVRVDATAFARVLDATPSGCVFPSGDLDNLAHFVQAYLKLPSYEPAVLVGVGSGAALVAGVLSQAPVDTFAGAIQLADCPGPALERPLCPREASPDASGAAEPPLTALGPAAGCIDGTSAVPTDADDLLAPLPAALERLGALARTRATAAPSDMADLPLTEVVSAGGDHPDTFGILLSGDGGWAGIDKALSARLARRGLPIVGIDSLRYFWTARTAESTAADLDRVIRRYQAAWKRRRVVLMGYSQGADVLPFILNRLPEATRASVVSAVALSLSTTATFEFHVSSWIGASGDQPTLPEVQRLAHTRLVCVFGTSDHDALCPALSPDAYRIVALPGDHHFNGDYDRLTSIVLESVPPG